MKRPVNEIPAEVILVSQITVEAKASPGKKENDSNKKEIETIAENIKTSGGLFYPIVVVETPPVQNGSGETSKGEGYKLKAGSKRLAAAKTLGWREIKAVVIPYFTVEAIVDKFTRLIEDCQRKELSDYDLAKAAVEMKQKWEIKGADFARVMRLSQGYTYNLTRWYSALPSEIKEAWKTNDALISQAELELMSHMPAAEAVSYFRKRKQVRAQPEPFTPGKKVKSSHTQKPRRASETQLLKLQEALAEAPIIDSAKQLGVDIIKFALGITKDVPGITDYKKLPAEILSKEARRQSAA